MRRFEREVVDYKLIEAMLQEMNIINVGDDRYAFECIYTFYESR